MSASSKKKLRKELNAAQMTEKQQQEQKEAKKLKIQTIAFVVVIALILTIGLGSLAITAFDHSGISERISSALTVGEHKLTATDLNFFYIDTINEAYSSWYSYYGEYTAAYVQMMIGLDMTQPLNEQLYDEETNRTFADYFAELAIDEAVGTYAAYDMAVAQNYVMTEDEANSAETIISSMETTAQQNGFTSLKECLKAYYGHGATEKSFRKYIETVTLADAFKNDYYSKLTYEDSELSDYSDEHYDDFSSFSYCTFTLSDDDFLVCTAAEDDEDHKHSDEEYAAAIAAAEQAADALVSAAPVDAEALNSAIKDMDAYAEDDLAQCVEFDNVLFTSITSSEDITAWLVEDDREAGDMTVITNSNAVTNEDGTKTEKPYGYTVVLFLERNDNNMNLVNVRHILSSFSGGTTDENGNVVYSDEEKQIAADALMLIQNSWLNSGGSEDSFSALATAHSTDTGSKANGGLYSNVYPGQMVEAFNDWCFDEAREAGDYDIVETEFGYHLIYFVSHSDVTFRNYMIENTMRNDDYNTWYNELVEGADHTVLDTSKLSLDLVMLG